MKRGSRFPNRNSLLSSREAVSRACSARSLDDGRRGPYQSQNQEAKKKMDNDAKEDHETYVLGRSELQVSGQALSPFPASQHECNDRLAQKGIDELQVEVEPVGQPPSAHRVRLVLRPSRRSGPPCRVPSIG